MPASQSHVSAAQHSREGSSWWQSPAGDISSLLVPLSTPSARLTKDIGAASAMGWHWGTAGVSRHPRLAGTIPGSGDCPGIFLSPPSPSPPPFVSSFPPNGSAGFVPAQGCGMRGEAKFQCCSFSLAQSREKDSSVINWDLHSCFLFASS